MKLYLASGNAHKAREFQELADALSAEATPGGLAIASAREVGGMPPVIEDSGTFLGNARKKAVALRERVPEGAWVLSDDSGLCVDALGGGPGVDSAYFAGPQADAAANLAKLVREMRDVPDGRRAAEYVCVLVVLGPGGVSGHFEGRCAGRLIREPRGDGGFGYDPLFVPEGFDRTLAELAPGVKNGISHRGRAWIECVGWLAARP